MDHLTPSQLRELRGELDRVLARLERSMKVTDEAARPVELDQSAVGRLSRMDSLQNQGLTRNLQDRERARLAMLRQAYDRLEDGSYGRCVECRQSIPFERLMVFPETPVCARCG